LSISFDGMRRASAVGWCVLQS